MSFSSGSSGNCSFLGWQPEGDEGSYGSGESRPSGILIDSGISLRRLKKELFAAGLDFSCIGAVLVTHDHLDHIRFLGSYCKRVAWPVYATSTLHRALAYHSFAAPAVTSCRKDFAGEGWTPIPVPFYGKTFDVKWFEVPHDATQTVGFAIRIDGSLFVLVTDSGSFTPESMDFTRQADNIVIESNYDSDMLAEGPYPPELQQRIRGGHGHLSNNLCADAIREFWHPGLRNIFLCHLSENNNTPELALESSARALSEAGGAGRTNLFALPRTSHSRLFVL